MEKISFDTGVRSYKLGEGVLKLNPGDPNLYGRFLEGAEQLRQMEKQMVEKAATADPEIGLLQLMQDMDRQMKQILDWIFTGNEFDRLLGGVNLLAVADNGQRVITNLFTALEPVLVEGAERCAAAGAEAAVGKAKARRGSR